ncbi:MAG: hypothetical protein K6G47_08490 [Clostridia bacterium]|nr:hypothetical protein [Clostridia bacterium]
MNNIRIIKGSDLFVDVNSTQNYGIVRDFDPKKAKDLDYLTNKICEMMKGKREETPSIDVVLKDNLKVYFPQKYVEAAHIIMAISIFKSFRDQGLLTEEEYREITRDEEKHWRELLYGDSMVTNCAVYKEGVDEQKSSDIRQSFN